MDQRNEQEEEDGLLKEPTDQRSEEESPAGRRSEEEEPTNQRKVPAAAAEEEEEEERSSDEESVSASALFVHPCSLLQCLARAFACCLGMQPDSFGGTGTTKPSASVAPASVDSSREGEADRDRSAGGATGFYVQEVITRVWAVRRGPRPPGKPREGSGGNGGHHH